MKILLLPLSALLVLAGCNQDASDEPAGPAAEPTVAAEVPAETAALEPTGSPTGNEIPLAIQGRWGLVAADCEPGRADAKGLLTITKTKLEFYESVGTLDTVEQVDADSLRADFDFVGEGMEWEREVALELQEGGAALIRREYGEDAAPGAFRYTKCA